MSNPQYLLVTSQQARGVCLGRNSYAAANLQPRACCRVGLAPNSQGKRSKRLRKTSTGHFHSRKNLSTQTLTCSTSHTVPVDQQAWGSFDTLQQQVVGTERENSDMIETAQPQDIAEKLVVSENSGPRVSHVVTGLASLLPSYVSQPWSLHQSNTTQITAPFRSKQF